MSTSGRRPAGRSRCTGPARPTPALLGRDYVIPDDVKALAEPCLAHRLIIKTSATIHDVQPAQIIRELLDTLPVGPPSATLNGPREIPAGSRDDPAPRVAR